MLSKLFCRIAQITSLMVATGPLLLCLVVFGCDDAGRFLHYWVYYMLISFITSFVSMVLMQILP